MTMSNLVVRRLPHVNLVVCCIQSRTVEVQLHSESQPVETDIRQKGKAESLSAPKESRFLGQRLVVSVVGPKSQTQRICTLQCSSCSQILPLFHSGLITALYSTTNRAQNVIILFPFSYPKNLGKNGVLYVPANFVCDVLVQPQYWQCL